MTGVFEELRPALNCRVYARILALKRRAGALFPSRGGLPLPTSERTKL
jgi:hypothetical protein